MRTMSECIEEAAAFTDFRDRLLADDKRARASVQAAPAPSDPPLGDERQPGENRAAHRARLKAERRAAVKASHG